MQRRRLWFLVAGGLLLVIVVAALLLGRDDRKTTTGPNAEPWSTDTLDPAPDQPKPTALPTALPTGKDGLPNLSGLPSFGMPGLTGNGFSHSAEPHQVTMKVSSNATMVYAGWRVPSADKSHGAKPSEGFNVTVTGYGPPDLAQIFVTAGPGGRRTECTITVDGKVTEHRVATGPYAYLFCQG